MLEGLRGRDWRFRCSGRECEASDRNRRASRLSYGDCSALETFVVGVGGGAGSDLEVRFRDEANGARRCGFEVGVLGSGEISIV